MILQFRHYSAEKDTIKSDQFAKLLLQSTPLDEQDVKDYLQRLESRLRIEMVGECTVVNLHTTRIVVYILTICIELQVISLVCILWPRETWN